MNSDFHPDLEQSRKEGFEVALGERVTDGLLLRVSGHEQSVAALCNAVQLTRYSEVELCGENGAPSLFVSTRSLLDNPQLFVGYHVNGTPLLLGLKRACEGHISMVGQSRSGKTTEASSLAYQACALGLPVCVIGCKDLDPMLLGPLKAACDAPTRLDKEGNPVTAPFRYVTMRSNTPTGGFNYFDQDKYELPNWLLTAELLKNLGQDGSQNDPVRRYYIGAAQTLFQSTAWGKSAREFMQNIKKKKIDEETKRSTAGAVHDVSQLAEIEHLNLPRGHWANIDLGWVIDRNGCVYFDTCYMEIGALAVLIAGLVAGAFVSSKRKKKPKRRDKAVLVIDEAQMFPISYLRQLVEQCASSGIILIIIFHNLSQLGEHWESIAMTQVKFIFSAVPRSLTDEHLQALFGTRKEYVLSLTDGIGSSTGTSISPSGISESTGESRNSGVSFQEKESFAWNPNDTLSLNYNKEQFVVIATPGAEISYWGPTAILAKRGGAHMSFADIDRAAEAALADVNNTMLPGKQQLQLPAAPEFSPELTARRVRWAAILNAAASKIRKEFTGA